MGKPVDISALSYPALTAVRSQLLSEIQALAVDHEAALTALKLGPKGLPEVMRNKIVMQSPTMSAVERYTGVLYDALDVHSLEPLAREWISQSLVIHSALWGLVSAEDLIPAYRLSHDSRLPGGALKKRWADLISAELAQYDGLIIDLRSEGYVELGPTPVRPNCVFLRVVGESESGQVRALNHFNKKAKGLFVRDLSRSGLEASSVEELRDRAASTGWRMRESSDSHSDANELLLVAPAF